eukprot:scaffold31306_cov33-Prasinocladus_malaysianus.AAC.2
MQIRCAFTCSSRPSAFALVSIDGSVTPSISRGSRDGILGRQSMREPPLISICVPSPLAAPSQLATASSAAMRVADERSNSSGLIPGAIVSTRSSGQQSQKL